MQKKQKHARARAMHTKAPFVKNGQPRRPICPLRLLVVDKGGHALLTNRERQFRSDDPEGGDSPSIGITKIRKPLLLLRDDRWKMSRLSLEKKQIRKKETKVRDVPKAGHFQCAPTEDQDSGPAVNFLIISCFSSRAFAGAMWTCW